MAHFIYTCGIDAEPLERYKPGGYHPLSLGDCLKDGRYRILHKLGWGGYSTTWAAKDESTGRYVAVKVKVANAPQTHELEILRAISALSRHSARHPGSSYLNQLLDDFTVVGPNGWHDCLVLELVGPNVADMVFINCADNRLPAKFANLFTYQVLQGLDALASYGIGHGDLHTRNLAITVPGLDSLDESAFVDMLGTPETGPVSRRDSHDTTPLPPNVPSYMLYPAPFDMEELEASQSVQIIDYGESFVNNNIPATLHTPLSVRAPAVIFDDAFDYRVDLWSAGCLLFELVTGQSPFDGSLGTKASVAKQMIQFAIVLGALPSRWQDKWQAMQTDWSLNMKGSKNVYNYVGPGWLEKMYFVDEKDVEFTKEDIVSLSRLIQGMLTYEASQRATARNTLADGWFKDCVPVQDAGNNISVAVPVGASSSGGALDTDTA